MLTWLKSIFAPPNKRHPESRFIVTFDDHGIRCQRPSGDVESVTWNDLTAVIIETNDTGPWGTDVWWFLIGTTTSSGCVIPQGATGEEPLLHKLQSLPGFDNAQFIAAMSSTDNRQFLCWKR